MPTNTVVGSARAIFTISLVAAATEEVRVDWATKDGTAIAGRDYETNSGTVIFAPGETSKTVEIFVHGRTVETEDRVFYVLLDPPVNALLADEIGACIIHVDAAGTVPVMTVIIPRGEKGLTGDSAYQIALNNGFVGTQAEWLASLRPSPEEIAPLVAPLINAGIMNVTAAGTEGLAQPDTDNLKGFAGRIALTRKTMKAIAPAMTAGDNVIPLSAFVGEAVSPKFWTGFSIKIRRGTALLPATWDYLPGSNEIKVYGALAGDIPLAVQQDVGGGDLSKAPIKVGAETDQLQGWILKQSNALTDAMFGLRADFAATSGATLLGHDGGQASEFLSAGFFQPNDIDLTGVTLEKEKLEAYLEKYKRVRLPEGSVNIGELDPPDGTSLVCAGKTRLNRATKVWQPGGTTLIGTINLTGKKGCVLMDFNIDGFVAGNAIVGLSDSTEWHYIRNVAARASDHNFLFEQNGADSQGRYGGNILCEDCDAYDGPNGFVSKMINVTFRRCFGYDITVQSHVAVSDNINGPNIYSRAQNTRFEECGGDGCHIGCSIYSHDFYHGVAAVDHIVTVSPSTGTYWSGTHTNVTNCQGHVGDYSSDGTYAIIFNNEVTIGGGEFKGSPLFAWRFDYAGRPRVLAGHFVGCVNPIVIGSNVVDLYVDYSVTRFGAINPGILSYEIVESSHASAINVSMVRNTLVVRNTVPTTIAQLVTGNSYQKINVVLDDDFTTVTLAGKAFFGKGSAFSAEWNGELGAWRIISAADTLPDCEVPFEYAFNLDLFWRSKAAVVEMAGNINFLHVSGAGVPGTRTTLRLHAPSAYSVFTWDGVVWGATAPVGAIPSGQTVLIEFYWTGVVQLVKSVLKF